MVDRLAKLQHLAGAWQNMQFEFLEPRIVTLLTAPHGQTVCRRPPTRHERRELVRESFGKRAVVVRETLRATACFDLSGALLRGLSRLIHSCIRFLPPERHARGVENAKPATSSGKHHVTEAHTRP